MNLQVGWGIIGTPQGREFLGEGLSKGKSQLNFDLAQEIGGCLPELDKVVGDEFLYCLKHEVVRDEQQQQRHLIGFAVYTTAAQRDGYRSGNYFGAFVESVDGVLSIENYIQIIKVLLQYQLKHFIDKNMKKYIKHFEKEQLDISFGKQIFELKHRTPDYLENQEKKGDIYIHCIEGKVQDFLTFAMQKGLFYRYKNIFFSDNKVIFEKIKTKKIEKLSDKELYFISGYVNPYEEKIAELYKNMRQEQKKVESVNNALSRKVKELEEFQQNKTAEIAEKVKAEKDGMQQLLTQKEQEIAKLTKAKEELEKQRGKEILKECYEIKSSNDSDKSNPSKLLSFENKSTNISSWNQEFSKITEALSNIERKLGKSANIDIREGIGGSSNLVNEVSALNKKISNLSNNNLGEEIKVRVNWIFYIVWGLVVLSILMMIILVIHLFK